MAWSNEYRENLLFQSPLLRDRVYRTEQGWNSLSFGIGASKRKPLKIKEILPKQGVKQPRTTAA
jgi:hypothetical protein